MYTHTHTHQKRVRHLETQKTSLHTASRNAVARLSSQVSALEATQIPLQAAHTEALSQLHTAAEHGLSTARLALLSAVTSPNVLETALLCIGTLWREREQEREAAARAADAAGVAVTRAESERDAAVASGNSAAERAADAEARRDHTAADLRRVTAEADALRSKGAAYDKMAAQAAQAREKADAAALRADEMQAKAEVRLRVCVCVFVYSLDTCMSM
jgi:chromosome segregation ATPase